MPLSITIRENSFFFSFARKAIQEEMNCLHSYKNREKDTIEAYKSLLSTNTNFLLCFPLLFSVFVNYVLIYIQKWTNFDTHPLIIHRHNILIYFTHPI